MTKRKLRTETTLTGVDECTEHARHAVERHLIICIHSQLTLLVTHQCQHLICTCQQHVI